MTQALSQLGLPDAAVAYLSDFYHVLQAWDDFVDGDEMPRDEKDRAIWASLVGMPTNPFYIQNCHILQPLISNIVLKWKAADSAEREGKHLHMAYAWRAGYFDLVLQVLCIVHGSEAAMKNAHHVMALYAEDFDAYAQEFANA